VVSEQHDSAVLCYGWMEENKLQSGCLCSSKQHDRWIMTKESRRERRGGVGNSQWSITRRGTKWANSGGSEDIEVIGYRVPNL
ncbi:hypothetical protein AMECASPLE_001971, partial [Ameca splendens]